jgi:hypothetical protein
MVLERVVLVLVATGQEKDLELVKRLGLLEPLEPLEPLGLWWGKCHWIFWEIIGI